jgi:TolB-like protein
VSFLAEIRRRNVIRMAGLYLVAAWLAVQVASTLLPAFDAPAWTLRAVILVLAVGFIPALVFAWVFELTPEGLKRDSEVPIEQSIAPRTARRLDRAIIAVLAAALVYFAIDKFVLAPHREAAAPEQVAKKAESIAVLPLANEGGDKDQQYFADGLSENLITALSRYGALKVISRNSAFQFRNSKATSAEIGRLLGVAHLLEGSVQRAQDEVRITATLVNASDGSVLWSRRYDKPYKDLFALQDAITQSVAGTLKAKLLTAPGAVVQSDRPPSGNLDAYTAYQRGVALGATGTEAGIHEAIEAYTEATRLDPHYAAAYAKLTTNWMALAITYAGAGAKQAFAKARAASRTALALDPDSAAAHLARGTLLQNVDMDWRGAEVEAQRALQLEPNGALTQGFVGTVKATLGDNGRALELARLCIAADPRSADAYFALTTYLIALGRLDEARQAIEKTIDLQSQGAANFTQLAIIDILDGDAKAALAAAKREPPGPWHDIAMALALQVGSDHAAADSALDTLVTRRADTAPYQIAETYALRQDPDAMFKWLEHAWTVRDPGVGTLLSDPFILRYKNDPRFAAFCGKVGLPTTTDAVAMKP